MQRSGDELRPDTRRWTVRDAIDFEALLRRDTDAEAATFVVAADADRRAVFRAWLERRRVQSVTVLPGERYERGRRVVAWLAVVTGLATGVGVVGGLLARGDAEPINALLFFGGTVGIQLVVLAVAVLAWLLARANVRSQPLRDLLLMLVRTCGRLVDRLDGERRSALRAGWAGIDPRSASLAPLIGCQMLIVTQGFAIAFNVGVLAALLLVYLPFVELRFGWQTTYAIGPEGVDAWVRIVALPWSWIPARLAPDAAQIAATQFTRGQSATTLPAAAAHAWWPFLVCAIVVYGLAVRAALALVATAVLRRRLGRLAFTQPTAHVLWRRLTGPLVVADANVDVLPEAGQVRSTRHDDLRGLLVVDRGLDAASVARIFPDAGGRAFDANIDDDALPAALVAALGATGDRVIVVTSRERDPVVAVADFLRAVAAAARPGVALTVLLIGDESSAGRRAIWSRFVAIHRLAFDVEAVP